jgi:pimeloyl-ACP methyl ester carboxylesterase
MTTDGRPLPTARLARGSDFTPDPALYPFASRRLASSAGAMHYSDEGGGPAILFCHGNPTSSSLYRGIIERLRGRFRCVAADLHGLGLSERPATGAGGRRLVRGLPARPERRGGHQARPERRGGHHPVRSVRPAAVVVLAEVLDHDFHLGEDGSTIVFAMQFPTPSVGLITESSSPGGWRLVPVTPDPRPASGSTARGRTRRSRTRRWQQLRRDSSPHCVG